MPSHTHIRPSRIVMVGSVEAPDSARDTSAEKEWAALELDSLAIRKRTRTRLVLIGASVRW